MGPSFFFSFLLHISPILIDKMGSPVVVDASDIFVPITKKMQYFICFFGHGVSFQYRRSYSAFFSRISIYRHSYVVYFQVSFQ